MFELLISFSGGRTSAFMTKWILDSNLAKWRDIVVVFANTGKEREETLEFVKMCDDVFGFKTVWVEAITNPENGKGVRAKIVDYKTASRNGEPYEAMIAKHGIPSVKSPHCTRELKKYTIRAYAKSIGWKKYETAIGIRIDEVDRISPNAKKERLIYPLISMIPTRKSDINKFWSEQSFDLRLKSYQGNCDLCFKKSYRKLMTIVKENPELVLWWSSMEYKYHDFIPEGKKNNKKIKFPINFFRQNKSVWEIINMAKNDFELAVDESIYHPEYLQGDLWGIELDVSNGCTESCEVF
jgi:3'-phosphoadenosine 5'-phosphosulfate sulfotransferase (PAPS reductase)/FAD synthetase